MICGWEGNRRSHWPCITDVSGSSTGEGLSGYRSVQCRRSATGSVRFNYFRPHRTTHAQQRCGLFLQTDWRSLSVCLCVGLLITIVSMLKRKTAERIEMSCGMCIHLRQPMNHILNAGAEPPRERGILRKKFGTVARRSIYLKWLIRRSRKWRCGLLAAVTLASFCLH